MPCRHTVCDYHKSPHPCPFHAQGEEARGFEIQDPQIEAMLRSLGWTLKRKMPSGYGFSLFIFSYGEGGNCFYISSANREDFLKALQEFLLRQGYGYIGPTEQTKGTRD